MKCIGFSFLCLPGVVGMLMAKKGVEVHGKPFEVPRSDQVYPLVVRAVMPTWSLGLFAAVLLGTVLSTFNSALQSLFAYALAPQLAGLGSIFEYLQKLNAITSL